MAATTVPVAPLARPFRTAGALMSLSATRGCRQRCETGGQQAEEKDMGESVPSTG
jgi:hypothetical protein